ncbi:MAG UNVERIFIED_CONTAM: hypothetical protein LVR29_08855 [Microcystis novacekii LVE1205-3]
MGRSLLVDLLSPILEDEHLFGRKQRGWSAWVFSGSDTTNFSSAATGVSADGSVVVGSSSSDTGTQAFRWTQETGMVGLGFLSDDVLRGISRRLDCIWNPSVLVVSIRLLFGMPLTG